jgi:hypothetical protein
MKRLFVAALVLISCAGFASAQNSNSSTTDPNISPTTRERQVAPPRPTPTPRTVTKTPATDPKPSATPRSGAADQVSPSGTVLAAFNSLLDGIRHADVKAATNAYQNTPRLLLFNYNGTVTKGWDQLKVNREASYPQMKDVKLDVRDVRVTMLSPTSAFITCQWTQSMTFNGAPGTDSGRMTIVFRKIGKDWKAVHLHTSPDSTTASEPNTPRP